MRCDDEREAEIGEIADDAQDTVLMVRVEMGGRLVHQEVTRPLGEAAGDHDELPLPPAYPRVRPIAEALDPNGAKGAADRIQISLRRAGEEAEVGCAAEEDSLSDAEREDRLVELGDDPDPLRPLARGEVGQAAAVDRDPPRMGDPDPAQAVEEGRLPRPVRPEDRDDPPLPDREGDLPEDFPPRLVGERYPLGDEAHRASPRSRRYRKKRKKNAGTPIRPVRIPSGISLAIAVRATVSRAIRVAAPRAAEAGISLA